MLVGMTGWDKVSEMSSCQSRPLSGLKRRDDDYGFRKITEHFQETTTTRETRVSKSKGGGNWS